MRVRELRLGDAGHRMVIADGFYAYPEALAQHALALPYGADPALVGDFPGKRATSPLDPMPLLPLLGTLWGRRLQPFSPHATATFSILDAGRRALAPSQRQPHVDPGITALIHLTPDAHCAGGTAHYRHLPTGIERVTALPTRRMLRHAEQLGFTVEQLRSAGGYDALLRALLFDPRYAADEGQHINSGNRYWEQLGMAELRCNRLVLFDGRVLHSQVLEPGDFVAHPRLSQTWYLRERAEPAV
jgi:hypothetical protein